MPDSVLGNICDSLPSAINRYIYIVSVPNLCHSVGRQAVGALKEEAKRERHKAWLAWGQARCDEATARTAHRKAKEKDNWRKATKDWDDFWGQPGCGYKSIAKKIQSVPHV